MLTIRRPGNCARSTAVRRGRSRSPRCARRRDRSGRPPLRRAATSGRSRVAVANTVSSTTSTSARSTTASSAGSAHGRNSSSTSGQMRVERGLHLRARQFGAVAEAHDPLGRVVAVVGQLLDGLAGDRREHRVARRAEPFEQGEPPGAEDQQPGHQLGEVGVAVLDQAHVAELVLGAEERQPVLGGAQDRRRHGPAACGPGRAGRARRWPARSPPPAPACASSTAAAGGCRSARRRRASGSRWRAPAASSPAGIVVSTPCSGSVNPVPKAQRWSSPSSSDRWSYGVSIGSSGAHMCGTSSGMS